MKSRKDEGTARIEAFSDGVFAIAITLLVLEIHVPAHAAVEQRGLAYMLVALWPSYLAFVTSFVSILVIWVKHHSMFTLIERTDHAFLYWNGLLLFFVTLLPFPTALLADYLLHPDAKVAASLYTGTTLAISVSFKRLWRHATRDKRLLARSGATADARQITQQDRYGPLFTWPHSARRSFPRVRASPRVCFWRCCLRSEIGSRRIEIEAVGCFSSGRMCGSALWLRPPLAIGGVGHSSPHRRDDRSDIPEIRTPRH